MRKFVLLAFVFSTTIFSYSQVQELWARSHGSGELVDQAVDAQGNVYVTGRESGTWTRKYDKDGNVKWTTGVSNCQRPVAMAVDNAGNVYVVGITGGSEDHFMTIKFNANGGVEWTAVYFEDDVMGWPSDIAVDDVGNVFVTGTSWSAFLPESTWPDDQSADFVTVKYDLEGDEVWVRRYDGQSPGTAYDAARSIEVDPFGNIYVAGTSELNGQKDIVTLKYSTSGDIVWSRRYDNGSSTRPDDGGGHVNLDPAGNVIITGTSSGDKIVVVKYTFSGLELWAKNPVLPASGAYAGIKSIADVNNNIFVLGEIGIAVLVKFNAAGEQLWQKTFSDSEPGGSISGFADIATDGMNIYLAGVRNGLNTIKFDGAGQELWRKTYVVPTTTFSGSIRVDVDPNLNVFSSYYFHFYTIKYNQCAMICPETIRVETDPGTCGKVVNFTVSTTGDCGELEYPTLSDGTPLVSGTSLTAGHYHTTIKSPSTGASCGFTIYVDDKELPVFTYRPPDKSVNANPGVCYATAASVDAGTATATDNCRVTVRGARSDGLTLTDNYPVGTTTIIWTARDGQSNTATHSQTITVIDNQPPVISGESASIYVLSPSNHTMRDVTINYTATDGNNCGVTTTLSVLSNEPVNGVADGDTDPDWIVVDNHHVQLRAERSANGDGRTYTVTITATDPAGNTSTKTVDVRVPHNIRKPHSGQAFIVGSTVSFEGEFWDRPGNKHTAKWIIDGATTAKANVTEPAAGKNGKVTGSYKFTSPGVYKIQMNITDQNGLTTYTNTAGDLEAIVVIYDPNGGHTYGGGFFNSPVGALAPDPAATGKASYGFAMNYFKNSTFPKGETQFEFKVGNFEFNALNFDYLVINNSMSQFKGTGKIIGGQSGIGFTMTVTDGQLDGTGTDKIRMKIFNKTTGEIIYDNQPGASDAALPVQAVGSNSTIVISGTNSSLTKSNTTTVYGELEATDEKTINSLEILTYPNPSTNSFSIIVRAAAEDKITMQVTDMYGRVIETRNITANSLTKFGDHYRPGTYLIRIRQGREQKGLKLIKLSD